MNRRRGLTIIEIVVAMLVVSSMMAAALYAVAGSRSATARGTDRAQAAALADDLMGYIYRLAYKSPSGSLLGIELGDVLNSKPGYDDVDDFDGFREDPPQYADGSVIPGMTGWERSVSVVWVNANNPATVSGTESGVKRITVTVSRNGTVIVRRVALRTDLATTSE